MGQTRTKDTITGVAETFFFFFGASSKYHLPEPKCNLVSMRLLCTIENERDKHANPG